MKVEFEHLKTAMAAWEWYMDCEDDGTLPECLAKFQGQWGIVETRELLARWSIEAEIYYMNNIWMAHHLDGGFDTHFVPRFMRWKAAEMAAGHRRFRFIYTRDATESATITVNAKSQEEADEIAFSLAKGADIGWELDDGNPGDRPYQTSNEELPL